MDFIKRLLMNLFEVEIFFNNYLIDDNEAPLSIKDLSLYSIKGREYMVFKYQDKIVKIHKKFFCAIYALSEQNVKSLINLPTKRILMPTGCVYDTDHNIKGYTMNCVDDVKNIGDELMEHFLNEAYLLWQDQEFLSKNKVLLVDAHSHNAVYNGAIYLVDSGRYLNVNTGTPKQQLKYTNEKIIQNNVNEINNFLYEYIFENYSRRLTKKQRIIFLNQIKSYFEEMTETIKCNKYLDIIEATCDLNMTVNEYAKKLINKIN